MNEYDFALIFKLGDSNLNPAIYVDKLYESGCSDACIGIGEKGSIALDFIRESESAYDAISSAINDVRDAIPDATLAHVSPDIVGVRELSLLFDCTRQNIRKFVERATFPKPFYRGSQAIWYLETVLQWFINNGHQDKVTQECLDVATLARHININLDNKFANPQILAQTNSLVSI